MPECYFLSSQHWKHIDCFVHFYPVNTFSTFSLLAPDSQNVTGLICVCSVGHSRTSNTWMLREVTKRATPMPMKARPMRTNPGMIMPAESMGCHAGSLCWVKAVLSGRLAISCSSCTIFLVLLGRLLISSVTCTYVMYLTSSGSL